MLDKGRETLMQAKMDAGHAAESMRESVQHNVESAVNASVDGVKSVFGVGTSMGFLISLLLCSAFAVLLAVFCQYLYHLFTCQRTRRRGARVSVVKTDWKPDLVYMYQFPRTNFVPNTSPHCLKLLTFLRHHKIPHEVIDTMTLRSVEGKLPFVELNGEHLHDSELIIGQLIRHFSIDTDSGLGESQQGMVHAVSRMIEHATLYPLLYFKMGKNITKFYETSLEGHAPKFLKWMSRLLVYPQVWDKLNLEGTGLHTEQEVETILRADLKALDAILGEREWLIGDKPTLADFAFFGHIGSAFNLPYELPLHRMLIDEFPRLRSLHNRIAIRYFPDFDKLRQIEEKDGQIKANY